jgi:RHS repeat-associated protein
VVAPFGQRTDLAVDGTGNLVAVTNPAGEQYTIAYADGSLLEELANPHGQVWSYAYDSQGRLNQAADPNGHVQILARSELANGFEVSRTSPSGLVTTYRFQQLTSGETWSTRTSPGGAITRAIVRPDGTRRVELPNGTVMESTLGWDPRFGMQAPLPGWSVTSDQGLTSTFLVERVVELVDPANVLTLKALTETIVVDGEPTTSSYDAASRTYTVGSPGGRNATIVVDHLGRPVSEKYGPFLQRNILYDEFGRLSVVSVGNGNDARITNFDYGDDGYLASITDPLGRTAALTRDAIGRIKVQTFADGREVSFEYDLAGNLAVITPPGRPRHEMDYTPSRRLSGYHPPNIGLPLHHTEFAYDADRRLEQVNHPDGRSAVQHYDNGGLVQALMIDEAQYQYAYNSAERLASVQGPDGQTLLRSYEGPLLSNMTWSGSVSGTVSRTYDDAYRLVSVRVNGVEISYDYDKDDLMVQAGSLGITRDAESGLVVGSTQGDITDSHTYNSFGEPIAYNAQFQGTPLFSFNLTRDGLGRVVEAVESIGGTVLAMEYAYDIVGRLATVRRDGSLVSTYAYDENGNRSTGPAASTHYVYDAQDRLLVQDSGSDVTTYGYRSNGQLFVTALSGLQTDYEYDVLGNLLSVSLPDGRKIEYQHDGLNRRTAKSIDGQRVQAFVYFDRLKPLAELDENNEVVSRFVYAGSVNVPAYMVRDGVTYRIVTDHLGSPRLVVNVVDGSTAQRIDYDEFGNVLSDTNPGFQPFGFGGGLYDPDTGLVRFGSRDYDAATGRWNTKDPLLFSGGQLNLYAYARNDPINRLDFDGRKSVVSTLKSYKDSYKRIKKPVKKVRKGIDLLEKVGDMWLEISEILDDPTLNTGEKGYKIVDCLLDKRPKIIPFWDRNIFDVDILGELWDYIGDIGQSPFTGSMADQTPAHPEPEEPAPGYAHDQVSDYCRKVLNDPFLWGGGTGC